MSIRNKWLLCQLAGAIALLIGRVVWANEAQENYLAQFENLGASIEQSTDDSGAPIVKVNLCRSKATNADLKKLSGISNLHTLALSNRQLGDDGLRALLQLQNLRALTLNGTSVRDVHLREIAALKSLRSLSLARTRIGDAELGELASLRFLHTLRLNETAVSDAGLRELTQLKGLTHLYIARTKVTDSGLKQLATLKQLVALDISGLPITVKGLRHLAPIENLQVLYLSFTPVSDVGLKALTPLKHLQLVDFRFTHVTDNGLEALAALKSLRSLYLSNTRVTNEGLKHLANLKRLQILDVKTTSITDEGLKYLRSLKHNLIEFHLPYKITDKGFKELKAFKRLRLLNMSANRRVSLEAQRELRMALPGCEIRTGGYPRQRWTKTASAGAKPKKQPSRDEINNWIAQLGESSFRKREQAAQKLKRAGPKAAEALLKALEGGELEVTLRATKLLGHLLKAHDVSTEKVPVKTMCFLLSQGPPAAQRWVLRGAMGRYKDDTPGSGALLMKLRGKSPGPGRDHKLEAIIEMADKIRRAKTNMKKIASANWDGWNEFSLARLDAQILRDEEFLAAMIDALVDP